jgi:hypothetical protein
MAITTFFVSAILSLPKQFATVYLGYALEQQGESRPSLCIASGSKRIVDASKRTKFVQFIIIGVTIAVTIIAMRYIRGKQNAVKPLVIYERRKRRQAQLKLHRDSSSLEQGDAAPFFPPRTLAV